MAKNRGNGRGVVKVALGALLAACGALIAATGCSSEGSGGDEPLGVVHQPLICLNPQTGGKIDCGTDTECYTVACSKLGNGCTTVPIPDSDGSKCYTLNKELGACAAGVCCPGCIRLNPQTRLYECLKGTVDSACGLVGRECDTCSDGLCSLSQCNPEKGVCETTLLEDGKPCTDDSGLCLKASCCRGCTDGDGNCVAGNTVGQCGKTTPQTGFAKCENCDKGNTCSNYSCVTGVCAQPTPKPGTCADSTVCNGTETCGNNQCNPGTPLVCNDGNVCTDDGCHATNGCTTTPNTASCSDNNLCTQADVCSAGACKGGTAPDCDDNNPCTIDGCDPAAGCTNTPRPDNDPCDDGNDCSTGDRCVAGKCLASGGKQCDDANQCTKNTCNPQTQVCAYPNEDNGTPCIFDKCHQNSTCQNGACSAGTAIVCDDANPCTKDSCDEATGCVFEADDAAECSDGDACTTDDACANKVCAGTPVACNALDECHLAGTCDPRTGKCDDPRADDGTACSEGGPGKCSDGKCELLPLGGAGNEGGAAAGGDGSAEGGASSAEGGSGAPGPGSGGASSAEGGADDEERERAFVRHPGGCSCRVPTSQHSGAAFWLAGLGLAAAGLRRRRPSRPGLIVLFLPRFQAGRAERTYPEVTSAGAPAAGWPVQRDPEAPRCP